AWLEHLAMDLRYAARTLRRSPVFTLVVVLSLGLGVGANTAVFNLIHGVLMTPLPVSHPGRLVNLVRVGARGPGLGVGYHDFGGLRGVPGRTLAASRTLDNTPIAVGQQEDFTNVDLVDGGFYRTLELRPLVGRLIGLDDDQRAEHVVVL